MKCEDLTLLGKNVISVLATQIRTLTPDEFKNCIGDLNDVENHKPDQRQAYMQEAKEVLTSRVHASVSKPFPIRLV